MNHLRLTILFLLMSFAISFSQNKKAHTTDIKKAYFSPDNKLLVSIDAQNILKIWDINTSTVKFTSEENFEGFNNLHFSGDSRWLYYENSKGFVIRLENFELRQTPYKIYLGASNNIYYCAKAELKYVNIKQGVLFGNENWRVTEKNIVECPDVAELKSVKAINEKLFIVEDNKKGKSVIHVAGFDKYHFEETIDQANFKWPKYILSADRNFIIINGTLYSTNLGKLIKDKKLSNLTEIYDKVTLHDQACRIIYPKAVFPYDKIAWLKFYNRNLFDEKDAKDTELTIDASLISKWLSFSNNGELAALASAEKGVFVLIWDCINNKEVIKLWEAPSKENALKQQEEEMKKIRIEERQNALKEGFPNEMYEQFLSRSELKYHPAFTHPWEIAENFAKDGKEELAFYYLDKSMLHEYTPIKDSLFNNVHFKKYMSSERWKTITSKYVYNDYKSLIDKATIEYSKGNSSKAEEHLNAALKIDSAGSQALAGLAVIKFDQRKYGEVIELCETCLRHKPMHRDCNYYIGSALIEQDKYKEAQDYFSKLIKENPFDLMARVKRAYCYKKQPLNHGYGEAALKDIQIYTYYMPNDAYGFLIRALINADNRVWNLKSAELDFEKAIKLDKKSRLIRVEFGNFLAYHEKYFSAKEQYEEALKIKVPDSKEEDAVLTFSYAMMQYLVYDYSRGLYLLEDACKNFKFAFENGVSEAEAYMKEACDHAANGGKSFPPKKVDEVKTPSVGACSACKGTGSAIVYTDCYMCNGKGKITCNWCGGKGMRHTATYSRSEPCHRCGCKGYNVCLSCQGGKKGSRDKCKKCKGTGKAN
jgi:Tfp pilus assembly protein PilF